MLVRLCLTLWRADVIVAFDLTVTCSNCMERTRLQAVVIKCAIHESKSI